MNHYSRFSLILLSPFAIIASQNGSEEKKTPKITFVPGRTPTTTVAPASSVSNNLSDAKATSPDTKIVATPTSNDNELGAPYKKVYAQEQKTPYTPGRDGIAKLFRLDNSDSFIARLLREGKFAGAANNTADSFLPDHLRRTLANHQEELTRKSLDDRKAISEVLKKQRDTNNSLFAALHVLLDATTKHAPKEINLGSIENIYSEIEKLQADKRRLSDLIGKELLEQISFLSNISAQLDNLKKAQSIQSTEQGNK
ncbi:hypothetical protein HYV10_00545 [Candidatus Dependentiae bacterium]|nr:hypothetical protein [Candidatus Dependentiae bacterium]